MAANGLRNFFSTRAQLPEKLVTLFLLFILLTSAVAGITSVVEGPEWSALWKGLATGLLFGWGLAVFQQPSWKSLPLIGSLSVCYALVYSGGLLQRVSDLLIAFLSFVERLATYPFMAGADPSTINQLANELLTTTVVILNRVKEWVLALLVQEPNFDPVAIAFIWITLVWLIAAWAGWASIAYKNALLATLPVVMVNVTTLAISRSPSLSVYFLLGLTLLLVATVQHIRREHGWEELDTAFPPRKGRQIGLHALVASTAIVLISLIVSSASLPRLFEKVMVNRGRAVESEDSLAISFGIVPQATALPDEFDQVRKPGLPRESLIGTGPELSERLVMTVAVKDYISVFSDAQLLPPYWRSFTYDDYTGHGWRSSETTLSSYEPNHLLGPEQITHHIALEQVVRTVAADSSYLYAAGSPVKVNQSSEVAKRSVDDLFGIVLGNGGAYTVSSLISIADEETLRASGQDYPEWVRKYFLNLPPEVPNRVKEVALHLTAPAPTPYDRVRAIEDYLRAIPYNLDVPIPPQEQDLVDYFLFDLREGYCDYYASAMVVLSRAAGVPARFVIGYANGTYDLQSERFLVSEADAHSWAEIYFPSAGWVPFEPTAARPALNRSGITEPESNIPTMIPEELPVLSQEELPIPEWHLIIGIVSSICAFGIGWIGFDEIKMRRSPTPIKVNEIYRRLRRLGSEFTSPSYPSDTPYEYMEKIMSSINMISPGEISENYVAAVNEEIGVLVNMIVDTSFRPVQAVEADSSIFTRWKRLRWKLSLLWMLKTYQTWRARMTKRLRFLLKA